MLRGLPTLEITAMTTRYRLWNHFLSPMVQLSCEASPYRPFKTWMFTRLSALYWALNRLPTTAVWPVHTLCSLPSSFATREPSTPGALPLQSFQDWFLSTFLSLCSCCSRDVASQYTRVLRGKCITRKFSFCPLFLFVRMSSIHEIKLLACW